MQEYIAFKRNALLFWPGCEVLVTSDSGAGEINSLDKTSALEGKIECDWVIIGKPGSILNLKFLAQNAIKKRSSDVSQFLPANENIAQFIDASIYTFLDNNI